PELSPLLPHACPGLSPVGGPSVEPPRNSRGAAQDTSWLQAACTRRRRRGLRGRRAGPPTAAPAMRDLVLLALSASEHRKRKRLATVAPHAMRCRVTSCRYAGHHTTPHANIQPRLLVGTPAVPDVVTQYITF